MAEAEQAGRLLRLGEAQRSRPSPQVSTRPRGLGLLRPKLPRRARRAEAGGASAEGRRPRGKRGSPTGPGSCARIGRTREGARVRVRMGRPGLGTPVSAPVVLLRVRSPLPSGFETPCPNCFRCAQASGLGQPSTSVLSCYQLSARFGRKPQIFLYVLFVRALSLSFASHSSTPWIVALSFLCPRDFPGQNT